MTKLQTASGGGQVSERNNKVLACAYDSYDLVVKYQQSNS